MTVSGFNTLQKPFGAEVASRPAGSYQISYEHSFSEFQEHKEGTNEYVYRFPDHWIQYPSNLHSLSVRSVSIHPAARDIGFQEISLKSNQSDSNLDLDLFTNFALAYNEDMTMFNTRMKAEIKDLYENYRYENTNGSLEWRPTDFKIFYKHSTNELVFQILDDTHYFAFTNTIDNAVYTSNDFKNIVGIKNDSLFVKIAKYQNLQITKEELNDYLSTISNFDIQFRGTTKEIIQFKFKNVWNRGQITINSTLSTLAEHTFLALSNTIYPVPKYYEVKGFRNDFSIFLYDSCLKTPVELPSDGKDLIIIEMILFAR